MYVVHEHEHGHVHVDMRAGGAGSMHYQQVPNASADRDGCTHEPLNRADESVQCAYRSCVPEPRAEELLLAQVVLQGRKLTVSWASESDYPPQSPRRSSAASNSQVQGSVPGVVRRCSEPGAAASDPGLALPSCPAHGQGTANPVCLASRLPQTNQKTCKSNSPNL